MSLNLLTQISEAGCIFYSIPAVVYEYTRTANTLNGYRERLEFIKALGVVIFNRVEELIENQRAFVVAYNKAYGDKNKGPSYTDSLLCAIAYRHKASDPYIMTANHKDMPMSIYDRNELITIDIGGELHTEALYKLSELKLSKVLKNLDEGR